MSPIIIAGGDEAGRGAVIGPLVVSMICISKAREKKLAEIGVRDSKLLSPKKREFLLMFLDLRVVQWKIVIALDGIPARRCCVWGDMNKTKLCHVAPPSCP